MDMPGVQHLYGGACVQQMFLKVHIRQELPLPGIGLMIEVCIVQEGHIRQSRETMLFLEM